MWQGLAHSRPQISVYSLFVTQVISSHAPPDYVTHIHIVGHSGPPRYFCGDFCGCPPDLAWATFDQNASVRRETEAQTGTQVSHERRR